MDPLKRLLFPIVLALGSGSAVAASCPPTGWSESRLKDLKSAEFRIESAEVRGPLALALLDCLSSPDSELRDGIAFEAWSTWLRADQLDVATRQKALDQLLVAISSKENDSAGFRQPFSALVLSELARTDRKAPWLSPEQRAALVESGASYLESVRDYRGFDAREGWRHGVAHGSDLMLQLALNPALDRAQLNRLLKAVASQVAPAGEHSYVFGEPERLARPVLYAALRGLHKEADWQAWFAPLASPAPFAAWREAVGTPAGLARRHNTRAFLLAIYVEIAESKEPALTAMLPAVKAALVALP
jgi:hypothetical protein